MPTPATTSMHPLESFAPFRRWRPSSLRNLVYTFVWNGIIGVALTCVALLFGTRAPVATLLTEMLFASNVIGFLIHGMVHLLRRIAPGRNSAAMRVARLLLTACCALLGLAVTDTVFGGRSTFDALLHTGLMARYLPGAVVVALLMVGVLTAGERRVAREIEAARQQEQIAEAARLLAEAKLRTLQAQIEPHFLYNTLANVVSLIGSDPIRARHMLERLIDFLRASLSASRAEHATLGAEIDLARAYLDLLTVRMGARLRYRIDVDDACRAAPIAPMLIQPLVENAVMHGIEPKVDGGTIVVRARRVDAGVCVEVLDDGVGLVPAAPRPGGGVGLSNLRERLRSLHGNNAQLQLLENQDGGVTSRLILPV
ncbi:histidine kinase [Telluria mixta]|uniref:Histidine kinase n=1 Tax=Telluria mixta TaxID=34071 RepID=A0ABT2C0C1_9BURK|nr:histidine kinase [Telluria mixta]MCS0630839.1 histidine kinase [Telluria mixta]WEM98840.1 histidine kinase [Telluria mixta]